MTEFYSVWCEWDIGQDGLLFTSRAAAYEWARNNPLLSEEDTGMTFEDIRADGLLGTMAWGVAA